MYDNDKLDLCQSHANLNFHYIIISINCIYLNFLIYTYNMKSDV